MKQQLLDSIYNAFDKDPDASIGLIISHANGISWTVSGRVLTVSTELGESIGTYSLESYTINTLSEALEADGCTIVYQNVEKLHQSAATILDGGGIESESNGNHLLVYQSLLWSIVDAYALELEKAKLQIPEAIKQIIYSSSETEFLDYWGTYWGYPRIVGELDDDYRSRTIYEITRPRSNPIAIEKGLLDRLGQRFYIREPWKEVMLLSDGGTLSGDKHMQGLEWQYHYAQVVGWGKKLTTAHDLANSDRPAGTIFINPQPVYTNAEVVFPVGEVIAWQEWIYGAYADIGMEAILSDNLILSGYREEFRTSIAIGELLLFSNEFGANDVSMIYKNTFCRGEIILSDSDAIGTLQAHFGGYQKVSTGTLGNMSDDMKLSDSHFEWHYEPIDEWFDTNINLGEGIMPTDSSLITFGIFGYAEEQNLSGEGIGWTGDWDSRTWMDSLYQPMVMTEETL